VFSALYRVLAGDVFTPERILELEAPAVAAPPATISAWSRYDLRSTVFAGDGVGRYGPALETSGLKGRIARAEHLAGAVGCMAAVRVERGLTATPDVVRPLYVRRPDAEIHRQREAAR
jgi:hypothetical protein